MTRVSQERLGTLRAVTSERDRSVLSDLRRVRLLSSRQIERLHFRTGSSGTQARRTRRTLERLTDLQLVHRYERRVGGIRAGSAGFVYGLTTLGERVLEEASDSSPRHARSRWEPSAFFMNHVLAMSEVYVQIREAERRGRVELLTFDAEPVSWRWNDNRSEPLLKPDAYVELAVAEFEELRFVEVDLATESRPVLRRKLAQYVDCWHTGVARGPDGAFPSVTFLARDAARAMLIRELIAQLPEEDRQLFAAGTLDQSVEWIGAGQIST